MKLKTQMSSQVIGNLSKLRVIKPKIAVNDITLEHVSINGEGKLSIATSKKSKVPRKNIKFISEIN